MMKKWLWMATAGAAGLLLPEVGSAQGLQVVSPNVTGIYAGPNYDAYGSDGYGPGNYRNGRGRLRGRGLLRGRRNMEPVAPGYAAAPRRANYYDPGAPLNVTTPMPAYLDIRVPANAEILFDGEKTSQTGPNRTFVSPALEPGKTFTYSIMARYPGSDGKQVEKTRTVKVEAGRRILVDFLNPNQ